MKYTIDIQRVIGTNVVDDLLVLITEDYDEYSTAMINLINMFERNGTLVKTQQFKGDKCTRLYITYDFNRGKL